MRSDKVCLLEPVRPIGPLAQHARLHIRVHKNQVVHSGEQRLHQHLIPIKAIRNQSVSIDQRAEQELLNG